MPTIAMRRKDYATNIKSCEHAGLMLERGFEDWTTDNNKYNEQKNNFYNQLVEIIPGDLYKKAYERWLETLLQQPAGCKIWTGKVDGRLYLGLGEANPLESAVTLHHTYGVPFIPGSAIKGVLHHALLAKYATAYDDQQKQYIIEDNARSIIDTLFGREAKESSKTDSGDAGYVIFNDAWWIPGNLKPLVKEIITVHHQDYYSGNAPATDFDSPNPNPQIAIQGSFLFSVQGEASWAAYAIEQLQQALIDRGIGAKTASGYGYFIDDFKNQKAIELKGKQLILDNAAPEEKLKHLVENLELTDLPIKLGKDRNKTMKSDEIIQQNWQTYLELIREKFAGQIKDWKSSKEKNKKEAYKTIFGKEQP